jgi:hypothetical protein
MRCYDVPNGVGGSWSCEDVILSDGRHFLYVHTSTSASGEEQNGVYFSSLDGKENRRIPVAAGVSVFSQAYAPFTVSENGVLPYRSGLASGNNQLAWYGRGGKLLGAVGSTDFVFEPAISPDEMPVVFRRQAGGMTGVADLWLRDFGRGAEQRFTANLSSNWAPFWSPQGDRIVFASTRGGASTASTYNLYEKTTSGSAGRVGAREWK